MDRTVRLLREAMEVPGLSVGMAIELMYYYIDRNEIARKSQTKTWMARHEQVEVLLL